MYDPAPKCPHCDKVQSDCTNGGDPGEWYHDQYIPDGDCETECTNCRREFVVRVDWTPTFTGITLEDADL